MAAKKRKKSTKARRTTGTKSRRRASKEVRTEMHHLRQGKHKLKSKKQAVAVGLAKARAKGAKIPKKRASKKKR
ncbi:MAG TPA: DUF6496 domain-containing protein [Polyangia bacterium]|jgi:hypothetical protein|nr:DUF6496 domain-containing protein [Polyangia bacterium]